MKLVTRLAVAQPLREANLAQPGQSPDADNAKPTGKRLPTLTRHLIQKLVAQPPTKEMLEDCLAFLLEAWQGPAEFYEAVLVELVQQLRNAANPDAHILFRVVVEAPRLISDVLDELAAACHSETLRGAGFGGLRDAVLLRPPCRVEALQRLLALTADDDERVRRQAIAVCRQLHEQRPSPSVAEGIEQHALARLREGLHLPAHTTEKPPSADEVAQTVVQYASLSFALLLNRPQLFADLMRAYVDAPVASRAALLRASDGLIEAIYPAHGPAVLEALATMPAGAEPLVLKVMDVLCASHFSLELSQLAQRLSESREPPDARFLLPTLPYQPAATVLLILPLLLRGLHGKELTQVVPRLLASKGERCERMENVWRENWMEEEDGVRGSGEIRFKTIFCVAQRKTALRRRPFSWRCTRLIASVTWCR